MTARYSLEDLLFLSSLSKEDRFDLLRNRPAGKEDEDEDE